MRNATSVERLSHFMFSVAGGHGLPGWGVECNTRIVVTAGMEIEMPLFNETSHIYDAREMSFLRSCFSHAAIILEESGKKYSSMDLSSSVLLLYERGLRDFAYITELASYLAHQRYRDRHNAAAALFPDENSPS